MELGCGRCVICGPQHHCTSALARRAERQLDSILFSSRSRPAAEILEGFFSSSSLPRSLGALRDVLLPESRSFERLSFQSWRPRNPIGRVPMKRRVAVIGAGISGLGAARALSRHAAVTLYEAAPQCGGHAHTVDITLDGIRHGVDTGFLVLNERTYPELLRLFAELDIELAKSEMSFSVQVPDADLEWSGSNLDSVFAQRGNLLRPAFLRMLADLRRFNRRATALAEGASTTGVDTTEAMTIGEFLDRERYSPAFRDWYFLPMIGSIWSCPTDQMLRFPVSTMLRFCHNHGLLQVTDRPQWHTVRGGSRRCERIVDGLDDVRLRARLRHVRRDATPDGGGVGSAATSAPSATTTRCSLPQRQGAAGSTMPRPENRRSRAIRYHRHRACCTPRLVLRRADGLGRWNYDALRGARERASVA